MRFFVTLLAPDRRRLVVAVMLSALIYFGYLGTYIFADDKSTAPALFRWLWPLTLIAWPGWVMLFWPLALASRALMGTDRWVWAMGTNPSGLLFSYLVAAMLVRTFDVLRARGTKARAGEPAAE